MQHGRRVQNWGWFERWVLRTVWMRSWVRLRGSGKKIEQPPKTGVLPDSDEILRPESDGEARKLVQAALDPLVEEKVPVALEHVAAGIRWRV